MWHQPPGTDVCITFKSSLLRGRFTRPAEGPRARLATACRLQIMTEYSLHGLLTLEGTLFQGLTDQGFEGWPTEGSTDAPDHQSQGHHGRAIQATLECGVRDVLHSVQGQSRVPSKGDPIEGEHRALGPYLMGPSPA